MKNVYTKLRKLPCLIFSFVLVFSTLTMFRQPILNVLASEETQLSIINPLSSDGNFTFDTGTTSVGDTFIANVSVFNIANMTAWQVNVTFNPTILQIVDISLPDDHVFAGQSKFTGSKDINNTLGYVLWWVALGIGTTPVDVTEGRLCQIAFNITAMPSAGGTLACPIHIVMTGETDFYTKLNVNQAGSIVEQPFTSTDGQYKYMWLLLEPVLKVEPKTYNAIQLGETFQINVTMNNLVIDWHVIGVEFKLRYHPDMLQLIDVTEGPFMKQFPNPPNTQGNATIFMWYDEYIEIGADYLLIGVLLWPNMSGPAWTVFAEGNGTLATINLKTIKVPATCTLELFETKILTDSFLEVPCSAMLGSFALPETLTHEIIVDEQTFEILTVSNGSITPIPMIFDSEHTLLAFNVTGDADTLCFVNITLPTGLINAVGDQWMILVGGQIVTSTVVPINDTHALLSFQFSLSTKSVYIIGTWVIPEFQPNMFLILFFIAVLVATGFAMLTRHKKPEFISA